MVETEFFKMHHIWEWEHYLFQLFLHCALLLSYVLQLLCIFFWKFSPSLFSCALFRWECLLWFPVCSNLFLEKFLLHLEELLSFLEPFFILFLLCIIWRIIIFLKDNRTGKRTLFSNHVFCNHGVSEWFIVTEALLKCGIVQPICTGWRFTNSVVTNLC